MADRVDKAVAAARAVVDRLFGRAKIRLGLAAPPKGDKRLFITVDPTYTIPGIYDQSVRSWGATPRLPVIEALKRISAGYLDAQKEAAKAAIGRTIHSIARGAGGVLSEDTRKQLEDALKGVMEKLNTAVERIAATEGVAARNLGGVEAITAMAASAGVQDPEIFFATKKDSHVCEECTRLHMLPDQVTPRVWKMSEVSRAYHTRGAMVPSILGLHPHCRCTPVTMLKGWGFDASGTLKFISPDHSEFERQRALAPAPPAARVRKPRKPKPKQG